MERQRLDKRAWEHLSFLLTWKKQIQNTLKQPIHRKGEMPTCGMGSHTTTPTFAFTFAYYLLRHLETSADVGVIGFGNH